MEVTEDQLFHYGVKGMRWGHRKPADIAVAKKAKTMSRKEQNQQIKEARGRIKEANKGYKALRKAYKTSDMDRKVAKKLLKEKANEIMDSEDYSWSTRSTSGEKFAIATIAAINAAMVIRDLG